MADAAPTVLPLSPPDWDPDSAARRIAQLESALARRAIELEDHRAAFDAVVHTGPYKLGRLITKFYDRFLPFHSRRRLAFCVLLGAVNRGVRRLTGKDLDRMASYDPRDRLATTADDYARWIHRYEPTAAELRRQRRTSFAHQPAIRLLLSADDVPATRSSQLEPECTLSDQIHSKLPARLKQPSLLGLTVVAARITLRNTVR